MSMFGDLIGSLTGGGDGKGGSMLGLVGQLIERAGGIQGLLAMLQKSGLGDQVASWIGTGANQPVSGAQLGQALHQGGLGPLLQQAAQQFGLSEDALHGQLAELLPHAVDHMTPDGAVPQGGGVDLSALQGLAGRLFGA